MSGLYSSRSLTFGFTALVVGAMANVANADSSAEAARVVVARPTEFASRFAASDLFVDSAVRDALAFVLSPSAPSSPGIRVAATSGNGGRGGGGPSTSGHGLNDQGPNGSGDVVVSVQRASEAAQQGAAGCGVNDWHATSRCIADVLDAYAAQLAALAPSLPPQLQSLPGIVHTAAAKVRTARTKQEALSALASAQVQVNHTIALLRSDDPNTVQAGTQVGRAVNETLGVAQEALLRSSEL